MREIKFRAWDIKNKEMIDGNNLAFEDYAPLCELLQSNDNFIYEQFTGLKDKNGIEIYEGDLVSDRSIYGTVIYSTEEYDGIAGFMIDDIHDGLQNYDGFWHLVEVIGNIHEKDARKGLK